MSNNASQDHRIYQEWLHLEPDGELTRAERSRLERHLAGCARCRAERREVAALSSSLAAATVEVDPELARQVMSRLPAAGWEGRSPRAWRAAAAVFVFVALAAGLVGGLGAGGGASAAAPLLGAARAVTDLLLTTAVAGAGLLTASWQGLGLALGEIFGGSRLALGVFAVFVAGVDFLFVRYLLRRPRRVLAASRSRKR